MDRRPELKIVRQGRVAWNAWRKRTKGAPDLSRLELRRLAPDELKNFDEFDLSDVDMTAARLWDVSFRGSDLSRARAMLTEFSHCDFSGAILRDALFHNASFFFCKFDMA